ncbi:MAG TPA: hypothetical protein DEA08_23695 [Planctomycetes bacterium]|nr:hypothetical protein [Planctomycetota bacterium]
MALLFALVLGIGAVCDPLSPLGGWPAFLEPYREHRSRPAKSRLLRRGWEIVLLGSSRTESGVDPKAEVWQGKRVFNAGLAAGTLNEIVGALDHALDHAKPKTVLLELGLVTVTGGDLEAEFPHDPPGAGLLTWAGFQESLSVVVRAATLRESRNTEEGFRIPKWRDPPRLRRRCRRVFQRAFGNPPRISYSSELLAPLEAQVRACRAAGVRVVIYLAPVHALWLESLRLQFGDGQERMERDLLALVQRVNAAEEGPSVELWDFSGYTGLRAELVPPADQPDALMEHYFETSHYMPSVGERVVRQLLGGPGELGVRIPDAAALAAHQAARAAERARYRSEQAEQVEWLEGLWRAAQPPG